MENKLEKQIALLKKYGILNYIIEDGKITINGSLYLSSLTSCDKDTLRKNVSQLKSGYNKEGNYCFFDGILSKVVSVSQKKQYTIYTTTFGFVVEKGKITAHGQTIKKAIQDCEFKFVAEKLKKEPIYQDTEFTVKYYRLLTGAYDSGCRSFMQQNNIQYKVIEGETVEVEKMKAEDLLPLLEKNHAYGVEKFKQLINW